MEEASREEDDVPIHVGDDPANILDDDSRTGAADDLLVSGHGRRPRQKVERHRQVPMLMHNQPGERVAVVGVMLEVQDIPDGIARCVEVDRLESIEEVIEGVHERPAIDYTVTYERYRLPFWRESQR